MFFSRMLLSFVFSTITMIVILLIRRYLGKQLTMKWNYHLWFFFLVALTLPFFPFQLIDWNNPLHFDNNFDRAISSDQVTNPAVNNGGNWINDFSTSVNRIDYSFISDSIFYLWIIGIVVFGLMTLHAQIKLNTIRKNSASLNNDNVLSLFESCKNNLNITRDIIIKETSDVNSPMTFGLFKTYIILPKDINKDLTLQEIEYVLIHELQHFKCRHVQMNYLFIWYQVIYWFQPFVWWAFKEMKVDREMACDAAVLHSIDGDFHKEYGNAIINFADSYSQPSYSILTNQLISSKKHLKKRILHIAAFHRKGGHLKLKSIAIFAVLGILVGVQAPVIAATAETDEYFYFQDKNAIYEDLSDYFEGYEGSFVLYNMNQDQYYIHNQKKSTQRVSPNSTYKIYNALFALQQDVISTSYSKLNWDGTQHPYDLWNMDQDLNSALKYSVNWYFQRLDKQIEEGTIQSYLEKLQYGNRNLSGGMDNYWLESSLIISPIEQVQLLKGFYTNQFGFKQENINFVKDAIKLEEDNGAILYGKTGTGDVNGKKQNGWFIGFVETEADTFFFASNIHRDDHAGGSKAAEIALSILGDKHIY